MLQFKTVALPATSVTVKGAEMYTVATANKVLAPIAKAIENEAKGGWKLHSCVTIPGTVFRKIGILERFLGPIPIIGFFFRSNKPANETIDYYTLIFQKED